MKIYQNLKTSVIRTVSVLVKRNKNTFHFAARPYLTFVSCILVVAFVFYWFELRPSFAKKDCYNEAKEKASEKLNKEDVKNGIQGGQGFMKEDYDAYYKWCLQSKGI